MRYFNFFLVFSMPILLLACNTPSQNVSNESHDLVASKQNQPKDEYEVVVVELNDDDYPDNPDIGYTSDMYGKIAHSDLILKKKGNGHFEITILPGNAQSDTIIMNDVDIDSYLPNTPEWVRKDEYLTYLGIINQEWNRQQVRYPKGKGYWEVKGDGYEAKHLVRLDLARNCLNSGLWELIFVAEEDNGEKKTYYHGWFTFPMDLYASLFEDETGLKWTDYQDGMVDWKEPERKFINFDVLRSRMAEMETGVKNLNDQYYPLTGARVKKEKNIIHPRNHQKIQDFLSDETVYATFSPPGFYNTKDPRKTFLSLLNRFNGGAIFQVENNNASSDSTLIEIELRFSNPDGSKKHRIVFGGIDLALIPTLSMQNHNGGFKMPMGIANHAFYETYERCLDNQVLRNPYYALVVDDKDLWLDSHSLGIDGPLIFWDEEYPGLLHVMILSFERHSFVGHFTFQF